MQKTQVNDGFVLLPVPAEVAEELDLDMFSTIQYTISKGRLIIQNIEAPQSRVCFGHCRRCPGRDRCEDCRS